MFYFMEIIPTGKERIDWGRIISNNLDIQLKRLARTRTFYMSSYLIYSLAKAHEYIGLIYIGPVGMGARELRACDSYTQLHYTGIAHYKRVNNAFMMHITRTLQDGIHQRLSPQAKELIKKFNAWFIQFPKFTYIMIQGCSCPPYMLIRYPTDKIVLLELVRQLITYNKAQKNRHKTRVPFPISVGQSFEVRPSLQAVEKVQEELKSLLIPYFSRDKFDPYGNIKRSNGRRHKHKLQLEDHFMNAQDDLDIRRRMCSRLPIDVARTCKVFDIPNQAQDSERRLQPIYEQEKDKEVKVNWIHVEINLKDLMKPILAYTK